MDSDTKIIISNYDYDYGGDGIDQSSLVIKL